MGRSSKFVGAAGLQRTAYPSRLCQGDSLYVCGTVKPGATSGVAMTPDGDAVRVLLVRISHDGAVGGELHVRCPVHMGNDAIAPTEVEFIHPRFAVWGSAWRCGPIGRDP